MILYGVCSYGSVLIERENVTFTTSSLCTAERCIQKCVGRIWNKRCEKFTISGEICREGELVQNQKHIGPVTKTFKRTCTNEKSRWVGDASERRFEPSPKMRNMKYL